MNRIEFMQRLEKALREMPEEERRRAMEYYENYFDEADAEQEALDTLGAPEKVAADILRDFQDTAEARKLQKTRKRRRNCVLAAVCTVLVVCIGMFAAHTVISDKRELIEDQDLNIQEEIHSVIVEAQSAQVCIQAGDEWRLVAGDSTTYDIQGGQMYIRQENKTGLFQRKPGFIILTVPPAELYRLDLDIGAGDLEVQHMTVPVTITCHVATGSAYLADMYTEKLALSVDEGKITWDGNVAQSGNLYCDTGSMDILLQKYSGIGFITGRAGDGKVSAQINGGSFVETENMTETFAYQIPGTNETGELNTECNTGKIFVKVYTEGEYS